MKKSLNNNEVKELVEQVKEYGDNEAWEKLYCEYKEYILKRVGKCLNALNLSFEKRNDMRDDLIMAGWQGFISAIKNFSPNKNAQFITYATYYIDGEISKELGFLLDPLGLIKLPKRKKDENKADKKENAVISRVSVDDADGELEIIKALEKENEIAVDDAPDRGDYSAERRTLQILEVLRLITDEKHEISKKELERLLRLYRISRYQNGTPKEADNTFNKTMAEILIELNPKEYTAQNDGDYKVKYAGYQENFLNQKVKMDEKKLQKVKLAPVVNGLSYVHPFTYAEMDSLIQLVSFSDLLSAGEKELLIGKIIDTASTYYYSPFWDGERLRFNPKAIHGRFSGKSTDGRKQLADNLKTLQCAVNNLTQVRFRFNRYNAAHEMVPVNEYVHELSPYHLVVYHDNYYCIGLKKGDRRVWHYRVDLMSDIELVRDENGKLKPIEITAIKGIPIFNAAWNPSKYMTEHLNMAYDEPRNIRLKIKNTDYTILHDWFGDNYEKVGETVEMVDDGNETGYDIVSVRTSPSMLVHWAMQYGTVVEIMNEEIREKIREEVRKVGKVYGLEYSS